MVSTRRLNSVTGFMVMVNEAVSAAPKGVGGDHRGVILAGIGKNAFPADQSGVVWN